MCYFIRTLNIEDEPESITILNRAISLRNVGNFSQNPEDQAMEKIGCVEFLLANGADVNFANVSEFKA